MLHVADVALVLALRLRSGRATRPRPEAVVPGQIQESRMEHDVAAGAVSDHRALLVIDQDLARHAAEPFEGADQRLVGMFGILGVGPPEVKPARIAQRAHRKVHHDRLAGDHGRLHSPVRLQLTAWLRLEPDRRPARPQRSLGSHVVAQDRDPARVPLGLQLAEQHDGVPHALTQQLIYLRPVRVEHTPAPAAP
jgi:hypothetical protein